VAWLKKPEVRKTAEDGCHGVQGRKQGGMGNEGWSRYRGGPEMADRVCLKSIRRERRFVCSKVRLGEPKSIGSVLGCLRQSQTGLTPTGVASEVLQKHEAKRGTGKAERKRIGVCGRSTEDKGAEWKAKEGAGAGRKVAEASRMRLEAAEEVVNTEEPREANRSCRQRC